MHCIDEHGIVLMVLWTYLSKREVILYHSVAMVRVSRVSRVRVKVMVSKTNLSALN